MRPLNNIKIWGLGIGILAASFAVHLPAQTVKGLTKATKAVTAPMKDTQKAAKAVTEPIKEARTTTKAVTDAPKTVVREVKATEKAIDNTGNEIKRAKTDIEKVGDKLDGNKSDKTAATDSTAKAAPVVVNDRSSAPVAGSAENSDPSVINYQAGRQTESASTEPNYDYRRVLLPPAKGKTNLKSAGKGSKTPATTSGAAPVAAAPQPKPDYSASPAREALESADFAMETLTDLFQYATWEGPELEHNMRSIDYTLKQLKRDIDEIRYKDPERNVFSYEKQYREWRNTYVQHGGK